MPRSSRFLAWAVACGILACTASRLSAAGLELAVAKAKKTGLPLLVIGSGPGCPHCTSLKNRLSTEAELQPLLAQYVPLVLDVEDPEFAVWTRLYRPAGEGIPMLFIVSPKGEEFYNRSGAPQGDGLKQVLLSGIERNGGPKDLAKVYASPKDEKKLSAALRNAKLLLGKKSTAEAIALLVAQTEGTSDKSTKATPEAEEQKGPSKDIADLLAKLAQEATTALDKARENLAADSPETQLQGAVGLVEVRRVYSSLPDVGALIETQIEGLRADSQKGGLIEQANAIDVARVWEAKDNARAAAVAYRKVVAAYPDTPAAELSQRRIDQLGGVGAGASEEKVAGSVDRDADPTADLKKAVSMLKMAKTFTANRPEKAKEYAAKVIELAPKSAEAKEAQKLIDQLK